MRETTLSIAAAAVVVAVVGGGIAAAVAVASVVGIADWRGGSLVDGPPKVGSHSAEARDISLAAEPEASNTDAAGVVVEAADSVAGNDMDPAVPPAVEPDGAFVPAATRPRWPGTGCACGCKAEKGKVTYEDLCPSKRAPFVGTQVQTRLQPLLPILPFPFIFFLRSFAMAAIAPGRPRETEERARTFTRSKQRVRLLFPACLQLSLFPRPSDLTSASAAPNPPHGYQTKKEKRRCQMGK